MGSKDVLITFLKRKRKERDMSQNEFSELLSIPLRTYKGYEYGESSIGSETIDRIAEILNVTYAEMFTEEGKEAVISPKTAIEVLAKNLGYEIKIQSSLNNFFDSDLASKISQLRERELELLKLTVDKMVNTSTIKKKATI